MGALGCTEAVRQPMLLDAEREVRAEREADGVLVVLVESVRRRGARDGKGGTGCCDRAGIMREAGLYVSACLVCSRRRRRNRIESFMPRYNATEQVR